MAEAYHHHLCFLVVYFHDNSLFTASCRTVLSGPLLTGCKVVSSTYLNGWAGVERSLIMRRNTNTPNVVPWCTVPQTLSRSVRRSPTLILSVLFDRKSGIKWRRKSGILNCFSFPRRTINCLVMVVGKV